VGTQVKICELGTQ